MKTYREPPIATTVLLLVLVHSFTSQIGDAAAGRGSILGALGKHIPEEMIVTGNGDGGRVTAEAVAKDSTQTEDEAFSALLPKRELRRRHARPSSTSDQDANQSRPVIVNVRNDEVELETLTHGIAGYEPRRITPRKTRRRIVDRLNATHDTRGISGESAGSTAADQLQKTYHEMLLNIPRGVPELIADNADAATLNPYSLQSAKSLKQTRVPEATVSTDDAEKSSGFAVDSSHTSPATPRDKKPRNVLKKYLQPNRTATASEISFSVSGSKPDEEARTAVNNGSTEKYFSAFSWKLKNASSTTQSPLNIYSSRIKRPGNHREWNLQESTTTVPPFISRPSFSNAYNILNVYDLNNLNVPSGANALYSSPRWKAVPRPFSISQLPHSPVTDSPEVSPRKPSSSPVNSDPQQAVQRSSGSVLPLVLPTDLLNPAAARRYVPIKRANRLNPDAIVVNTGTSPPTSLSAGEITSSEKPSADYGTFYTGVTSTARSPLVAVNGHQSPRKSGYYPITAGNLAERTVAETARTAAATYVPGQTSALYDFQTPKDSQVVHRNDFLPGIDIQGARNDGKPDPNFNIGLALYNKFANLYSANAPKLPVAQDHQNFQQPASPSHATTISQQVSAPPTYYVTAKPSYFPLPKIQPIVSVTPALAPYYDSRLFVSQDMIDGKKRNSDKGNKENIETNERSRAKDADETEDGIVVDKNRIRETPSQQREKNVSEGDQQQTRDYGRQDRQHGHRDENDERKKHESVRVENDNDEEEPDETQGDKRVSTGDNENGQKRNYYYQYGKHKYDREEPEEQQQHKEHENQKDRSNKGDSQTDVKKKILNKDKYFDSRHDNDEDYKQINKEHRDPYYRGKSARDGRRKKNRHDRRREDPEDESVAEDKPIAQRSENQAEPRKEYEEKRTDDDYTVYKYRHEIIAPQRDTRNEEREQYSGTDPKHVRKEYHPHHHQYAGDNGDRDNHQEIGDHVHGETQEHAHKHKEHHEKKKDEGNHDFKKAEGAEHDEEHHGHEGEKGHKSYKVWHENEKLGKGHFDKEHTNKEFDEKDGEEKKHEDEGGYHEEHDHGEEGEKVAEFGEKGEHKKGHSTHGEHSVHKKDEYEKNTEFFDEFHEDGDMEKHGEHHHEHESKKGGHEKKGHHDAADHAEKYGKKEKHEKGGHHREHKGHKVGKGHDHNYDHDEKYGKKEGHAHGKKWSFKKGDDGDHKHGR